MNEVTGDAVDRVTSLELFFDLVFVFTITQLTSVLVESLRWVTVWHVAVMLGLIFWMYDGYAWLTNAVAAEGWRRQWLLLAGDGWFRLMLGLRRGWARGLGALAVLLAVPVGVGVSAVAALAATAALVAAAVTVERRVEPEPAVESGAP